MNIKLKKLLILNIPYLFLALFFTKVSQAWRYARGFEIADKILNLTDGFSAAFKSPLPSLHPQDLVVGILFVAVIRLAVYIKGKTLRNIEKV